MGDDAEGAAAAAAPVPVPRVAGIGDRRQQRWLMAKNSSLWLQSPLSRAAVAYRTPPPPLFTSIAVVVVVVAPPSSSPPEGEGARCRGVGGGFVSPPPSLPGKQRDIITATMRRRRPRRRRRGRGMKSCAQALQLTYRPNPNRMHRHRDRETPLEDEELWSTRAPPHRRTQGVADIGRFTRGWCARSGLQAPPRTAGSPLRDGMAWMEASGDATSIGGLPAAHDAGGGLLRDPQGVEEELDAAVVDPSTWLRVASADFARRTLHRACANAAALGPAPRSSSPCLLWRLVIIHGKQSK